MFSDTEKAYDTVNRQIERLGFDERKKDIKEYVQKCNSKLSLQ